MIKIYGDLFRRIKLNRRRMNDKIYHADELLPYVGGWPGDFPGRGILSLTSLYKALNGYEVEQNSIINQLDDIFSKIDLYLNKHYYFGDIFDGEVLDEQQISGNSWYLRGLIEYYRLTKNDKYLDQIKTIANEYLLKIALFYENYPIEVTREDGGVAGHSNDNIYSNWKLSSDIGCAFIMLDGVTSVYEILKTPELKNMIEKLIDKFLYINYVEFECQTHATLSCARGIFKFYKMTNDKKYLNYVVDIFNKYLEFGITYDYANINWFNRKNTWTEPCCIIDSLILSKYLYLETNDISYLKIFNRIYMNSLRTFQRDNGGAGCSTCAIDDHYMIKNHLYEAFFCCTMRLGEGLYEISNFIIEGKELIVPYNTFIEYKNENDHIIIDNEIYNSNKIKINVNKVANVSKIMLYVPDNVEVEGYEIIDNFITIDTQEASSIVINVKFSPVIENDLCFKGDMLLTIKENDDEDKITINGKSYSPIYDNTRFNEIELNKRVQYVK